MPKTDHASLTIAIEVTGHTVVINLGQTDRIIEAVIINLGQTGGTIHAETIEETIAVSLTVVRPMVAMAEGETLGSVIQEMAEVKTKSSPIMIGYAKSVAM